MGFITAYEGPSLQSHRFGLKDPVSRGTGIHLTAYCFLKQLSCREKSELTPESISDPGHFHFRCICRLSCRNWVAEQKPLSPIFNKSRVNPHSVESSWGIKEGYAPCVPLPGLWMLASPDVHLAYLAKCLLLINVLIN